MSHSEELSMSLSTPQTTDAQVEQLARQRENDMHRAMISDEIAVAFGGSALATAGIEHNVRGFVAAAALGVTALIVSRSGRDIRRAYHPDNSSEDQA